ncbi:hypothetical protein FBU59_003494 [Linderina macrospora]|uniref:Uncharacterized protein n=1 Tax=Linderina macrospora TaxID=4868 RepID=A0ACC1J871_9FUNG|nr:hypothetical protein FBU59_003494 [Linderina macrospora]
MVLRLQTLIQEQARDREAANKETKAWKLYQGKLFKTLEGQQEQYRQQIEGQKQEIKAQQQQIQAQQLQLQALELQQESFDTLKSI